MKRRSHIVVIGLVTTLLAIVGLVPTAAAAVRDRHHGHKARSVKGDKAGDAPGQSAKSAAKPGAQPGAQGPFAGAGGIFSPDYEAPGAPIYHLGGQILGGDFGKAYEDYYRHIYYYKYAYCPIGSSYVIYLRRCVSPFDLFK